MYDRDIVHGGFFDTFEYYYIVKKVFKNCNVKWRCITSYSKDNVLAVLREKYYDIEDSFDDIEVIPHRYGVLYRNPLKMDVIVCPTNSAMYWFLEGGSIQLAKSYIGMADWPDINPKQNRYYPNH